jgi:uncharacterized protein (DUF1697 family)
MSRRWGGTGEKEFLIEMVTYISMLRGINVGGQKKIKMAELTALYESIGLRNATTYVQSGNVIFDAPEQDIKQLSNRIEKRIEQAFGFPAAVLLRRPSELRQIIKNNPLLKGKGLDTDKLYVTFLSDSPIESSLSQMKKTRGEPDRFVAVNTEIYLYCPNGYGRTKFSNDFFERKLGVTATTRNWKTVNSLLELAESQSGPKGA